MGKIIVRKRDRTEVGKIYANNRIISTNEVIVYYGERLKEVERLLTISRNDTWELIDEKECVYLKKA